MRISEQRKLYDGFITEAIALLYKDNQEISAKMLEMIFVNPSTTSNLQLAFNNVIWQLDNKYEADMKAELENILKMIPVIADPEDENTKKIMGTIREMIEAENTPTETMTKEEIDAELGDEEDDNSPPAGLNMSTLIN